MDNKKQSKTVFVLEGGAMRGLYSAGVLDVLMQNGISTDAIYGVSAGALFGINFKSFRKTNRALSQALHRKFIQQGTDQNSNGHCKPTFKINRYVTY